MTSMPPLPMACSITACTGGRAQATLLVCKQAWLVTALVHEHWRKGISISNDAQVRQHCCPEGNIDALVMLLALLLLAALLLALLLCLLCVMSVEQDQPARRQAASKPARTASAAAALRPPLGCRPRACAEHWPGRTPLVDVARLLTDAVQQDDVVFEARRAGCVPPAE